MKEKLTNVAASIKNAGKRAEKVIKENLAQIAGSAAGGGVGFLVSKVLDLPPEGQALFIGLGFVLGLRLANHYTEMKWVKEDEKRLKKFKEEHGI